MLLEVSSEVARTVIIINGLQNFLQTMILFGILLVLNDMRNRWDK